MSFESLASFSTGTNEKYDDKHVAERPEELVHAEDIDVRLREDALLLSDAEEPQPQQHRLAPFVEPGSVNTLQPLVTSSRAESKILSMVNTMSHVGVLYHQTAPTVPYTMQQPREIYDALDNYGFCIVSLDNVHECLLIGTLVEAAFKGKLDRLYNVQSDSTAYGMAKSLVEETRGSGTVGAVLGRTTAAAAAAKNTIALRNPIMFHPQLIQFQQSLIPLIQNIAQIGTGNAYQQEVWYSTAHFPTYVNAVTKSAPVNPNDDIDVGSISVKRGRRKGQAQQGLEPNWAYFSPYFNQVWEAMNANEENHPNYLEHLQIIASIVSKSPADNVVRIPIGFHHVFPLFMHMVRNNEWSVTGIPNTPNPTPLSDTRYAINSNILDSHFNPVTLNVTIPEGCILIVNPKIPLRQLIDPVKSICTWIPISIWPAMPSSLSGTRNIEEMREQELTNMQIMVPSSICDPVASKATKSATANREMDKKTGCYRLNHRMFYRNFGPTLHLYDTTQAKQAALYHNMATWDMVLREKNVPLHTLTAEERTAYIRGVASTSFMQQQTNLYAAMTCKTEYDQFVQAMDKTFNATEFRPVIQLTVQTPECVACQQSRDIMYTIEVEKLDDDNALQTAFAHICLACLCVVRF